jgi:thioredoxin 1/thioredoxin 2
MSTNTLEVTSASFKDFIEQEGIVLLDWWAPWCGPCRAFGPIYEQAAEKNPDIRFGKINTDEQQELAQAFEVRSIPTLMVFRDKILLYAQPGSLPAAALDEILEKVRELDMNEVRKKIDDAEKASPPSA